MAVSGGSKTSPERLCSDTNKEECKERVKLDEKKTLKLSFKLPANIIFDKLHY